MDTLTFNIMGTDLTYTIPEGVSNPPVFIIENNNLKLVSYGFLPSITQLSIVDNSLWLSYQWQYEEQETILSEVKMLLGIFEGDLTEDRQILYWINSVRRLIMNYCGIQTIPESLYYVWVELVSTKVQQNRQAFGIVNAMAQIASITDGSQTVAYASGGIRVSPVDENLLTGYDAQLQQYRRIVWQ